MRLRLGVLRAQLRSIFMVWPGRKLLREGRGCGRGQAACFVPWQTAAETATPSRRLLHLGPLALWAFDDCQSFRYTEKTNVSSQNAAFWKSTTVLGVPVPLLTRAVPRNIMCVLMIMRWGAQMRCAFRKIRVLACPFSGGHTCRLASCG